MCTGELEARFFMAILAVQALSRVDPAVGVLVDVQNTLVNNIFLRFRIKRISCQISTATC